jgi:hypothetical protein
MPAGAEAGREMLKLSAMAEAARSSESGSEEEERSWESHASTAWATREEEEEAGILRLIVALRRLLRQYLPLPTCQTTRAAHSLSA